MRITYANKEIEKLCSSEKEMDKFFDHNQELVMCLKTLIDFLELLDNIDLMMYSYQGYNYEKILGTSDKYSLRIIPKKRKSPYRLYLKRSNQGGEIELIKIDKHKYKL